VAGGRARVRGRDRAARSLSVETFDPTWLELREDVDHRSRAHGLLAPLSTWWKENRCTTVLDLGSGTGSNMRYLAEGLPGRQEWTLIDGDADLLNRARVPAGVAHLQRVRAELDDVPPDQLAGAELVTASALLDLVSLSWLHRVVDACATRRRAVLFALTYDGVVAWSASAEGATQSDPLDSEILAAVNRHQRREKGMGPALGPEATAVVLARFHTHGYRTWDLPSRWTLGPEDEALARRLVGGWALAAREEEPSLIEAIDAWEERRYACLGLATTRLVVGHRDVLALPR
jgi:hypothetical protein